MAYGNRGYSRGVYNRNYNNNWQRQPKKKSGCRIGTDKKGRPCITGWNVSKNRGFVSFVAVPCKDFKTKSPNSDKWVVSAKFQDGVKTFTGFYNANSKKLTIPDLNMVANPSKNYFGTFLKRN